MFTAKQTELMNILGVVSDRDRSVVYESWQEDCFELEANGIPTVSFTKHLKGLVAFQLSKSLTTA